jgi:sulfopyruvate decarboxylase subunit alpha
VYTGLKEMGVDLVASVPCMNLREGLTLIDSDQEIHHVSVSREEEGIGICAGAFMGGKKPALLMQNSGLGNSVNAFASLNLFYGIPLLLATGFVHLPTYEMGVSSQQSNPFMAR